MTTKNLNYEDLVKAREAYNSGQNVTEFLRQRGNLTQNSPEIIEAAYDLQSGTYIKSARDNWSFSQSYASELSGILERYISSSTSLLDIGSGELTTLSLLVKSLKTKPRRLLAFDISWSRLHEGLEFARDEMGSAYEILSAFVAEISEIPLRDKSVDVTTSNHSLEPNGRQLRQLLSELFRVTIEKVILFEPCYEINSEEGKKRMLEMGYVTNIDGIAEELGGKVLEKIPLKNVSNPLNPTVCYVISPPSKSDFDAGRNNAAEQKDYTDVFSVPGTNFRLDSRDGFYFSSEVGVCFPVLKGIPILRSSASILANSLVNSLDN